MDNSGTEEKRSFDLQHCEDSEDNAEMGERAPQRYLKPGEFPFPRKPGRKPRIPSITDFTGL